MNPETEVDRIIREHGGVLARSKNHEVWKFPDGKTYVRACTPSDTHAHANQLRQLKALLGLNGERGVPGERRERRVKQGRNLGVTITAAPKNGSALQDQLRSIGLTEEALRESIAGWASICDSLQLVISEKDREIESLNTELGHHLSEPCRCWWCSLQRWVAGARFSKTKRP